MALLSNSKIFLLAVAATLIYSFSFNTLPSLHWSWFSFVCGTLTTAVTFQFLKSAAQITISSRESFRRQSRIYGLEHGILNLHLPPDTWWMNMGFWEAQSHSDNFPLACQALLFRVLESAGIVGSKQQPHSLADSMQLPKVDIVDVGFGCGDQSLIMGSLPNVSSYIGITLDSQQYRFAKQRQRLENLKLFQADAARPSEWPEDLRQALDNRTNPTFDAMKQHASQPWIIALDTLYHFHPSRKPLFEHAYQQLQASIAAFDLLLTDKPLTFTQQLLMRLTCYASSTPFTNFLTKDQYQRLLSSSGYQLDHVEILDVSEHVFAPLVAFMTRQDRELNVLGLGLGRFNAAKWLFSWWATSGTVRGCIVVARHMARDSKT